MIKYIKSLLKTIINALIKSSRSFSIGSYIHNQIIDISINDTKELTHNNMDFIFSTPNRLCSWRAETFSKKEPETLNWIDSLPEASILWDIGANVGLYSIYAAKTRNIDVWAFEPSVFNLEILARNINLNKLSNKISILPFALCDKNGISQMQLTTTEWGGALSTFDRAFGWDGKEIKKIFEYQTYGLKGDDAFNILSIPAPEYIKMDVDGLEHYILMGCKEILKNVKQILIEVNDDFKEQADNCEKILQESGLVLEGKLHSDMIASSTTGFQNSYNQIWKRP